mmetsp:Transcript_18052/g.39672  ORF Transcript_18052/g.39672 Transcript_18052/m.39672 type:complete len:264 (-) Transcript_18052:20-811(-)
MASQGVMGVMGFPRREDRVRGETMVLGLTGSVGMGKSTVSAMFRELGIAVSDADAVVRELYAKGGAAVEPVRQLFGDEVIGEDGGISRPALSELAAGEANAESLRRVEEEVVFPLVDQRREEFIRDAVSRGDELVVLELPLLMERGQERLCDVVAVASAPAQIQRRRVLDRSGMVEAEFEAILAKQVPDAEQRRRADVVIKTGTWEEVTRSDVEDLVVSLRRKVEKERRRRAFAKWLMVALCVGAAGTLLFLGDPKDGRRAEL